MDDLLGGPAVDAAVAALAQRNAHHLEGMDDDERAGALGHWRDLAITVLTAAQAAAGTEGTGSDGPARGRAVLVLEDGAGEPGPEADPEAAEVEVHVAFYPQLEELEGGDVLATPAQAAALDLLGMMEGGPGHEHG